MGPFLQLFYNEQSKGPPPPNTLTSQRIWTELKNNQNNGDKFRIPPNDRKYNQI